MADISITQPHALPPQKAKAAAEKVAEQMMQEYEMSAEWEGDVLLFKRSGVSGRLILEDKLAHLEISLGFLFKAFAGTIEEKVAAKMQKIFSVKA